MRPSSRIDHSSSASSFSSSTFVSLNLSCRVSLASIFAVLILLHLLPFTNDVEALPPCFVGQLLLKRVSFFLQLVLLPGRFIFVLCHCFTMDAVWAVRHVDRGDGTGFSSSGYGIESGGRLKQSLIYNFNCSSSTRCFILLTSFLTSDSGERYLYP